jgi:hypothetical protein
MTVCGAKLKATGCLCQKPPVAGAKRCAQHGGLSTGPKTSQGLQQSASRWLVHGRETRLKREIRAHLIADLRAIEERLLEEGLILGPRTRGRKPRYLLLSREGLWIYKSPKN